MVYINAKSSPPCNIKFPLKGLRAVNQIALFIDVCACTQNGKGDILLTLVSEMVVYF